VVGLKVHQLGDMHSIPATAPATARYRAFGTRREQEKRNVYLAIDR